jgi:hypothetical protein
MSPRLKVYGDDVCSTWLPGQCLISARTPGHPENSGHRFSMVRRCSYSSGGKALKTRQRIRYPNEGIPSIGLSEAAQVIVNQMFIEALLCLQDSEVRADRTEHINSLVVVFSLRKKRSKSVPTFVVTVL